MHNCFIFQVDIQLFHNQYHLLIAAITIIMLWNYLPKTRLPSDTMSNANWSALKWQFGHSYISKKNVVNPISRDRYICCSACCHSIIFKLLTICRRKLKFIFFIICLTSGIMIISQTYVLGKKSKRDNGFCQ